MPLSTDVEVYGTDGVWRTLSVNLVIRNNNKKKMRCIECKGHVKIHDVSKDGKQAAHGEHRTRWLGCPRSVEYDGRGLRSHPNQVST